MRYFSGGRSGVRSKAAHILAHIVLSSAVAATGGNDALTAGISAGGAELAAPVISKWLYGTDNSEELNADQKTTISAIAGLIGTGVGLSTGGSVTDTAASSQLTQNAVTNNWLSTKEIHAMQRDLVQCEMQGGDVDSCKGAVRKEFALQSQINREKTESECAKNPHSSMCINDQFEMREALEYAFNRSEYTDITDNLRDELNQLKQKEIAQAELNKNGDWVADFSNPFEADTELSNIDVTAESLTDEQRDKLNREHLDKDEIKFIANENLPDLMDYSDKQRLSNLMDKGKGSGWFGGPLTESEAREYITLYNQEYAAKQILSRYHANKSDLTAQELGFLQQWVNKNSYGDIRIAEQLLSPNYHTLSAPNEDYQEVYNRAARVLGYHESTDMQLAHAAEPGLYLLTGPVGTAVRATSNIAAAALIAQGGYEIGQGNYSEGVVQIVNGALLVSASTLTPKNVGKVSGSLVEADVSTTLGKELDLTTSTLTKLEEVSAKNTLVNNDKNTNLLKNIFEDKNRTVLADIEAQNVIAAMHEVVTTKRAKSITVMTHADGTVSVGIAGDLDNSKSIDIIERTQANLDKMYGKGRYNVGTTSLYEADGIIPVKDGNVPGVCGEGKCVQAASQNPSPVTGFATMWRGDGPNPYPYTGLNMGNLSSNQMGFCATCNAPQNQAIYSNTANQNKIMQHNTVNTINKRLEP